MDTLFLFIEANHIPYHLLSFASLAIYDYIT
jgi:hypothetical protein